MSEKYQYFNSVKFTRDDKTGYYCNSTTHKRMHVYVWEYYNGQIAKGYQVHHIDEDKSNNDITNLQLLTQSEHMKLHGSHLTSEQRDWRKNNINTNARPKAIEWHKSESGRKWHTEHIKKQREHGAFKQELTCTNCGKFYIGEISGNSGNNFCSNACKSSYRRKLGVDLVERNCPVCDNIFKVNKYAKTVTCSRSCANKYRWRKKNESKVS